MNSLQKQKLLSYYNSHLFRKGKPTLNRFQNLLLHQKLTQRPPQTIHFKSRYQKFFYYLRLGSIRRLNYIARELKLLWSSRIIRLLMIFSLGYLFTMLGKQIGYQSLHYNYPGYYVKPASPIKDKLKVYTSSIVAEILNDKQVEKEGVQFLSRLFTEK